MKATEVLVLSSVWWDLARVPRVQITRAVLCCKLSKHTHTQSTFKNKETTPEAATSRNARAGCCRGICFRQEVCCYVGLCHRLLNSYFSLYKCLYSVVPWVKLSGLLIRLRWILIYLQQVQNVWTLSTAPSTRFTFLTTSSAHFRPIFGPAPSFLVCVVQRHTLSEADTRQ